MVEFHQFLLPLLFILPSLFLLFIIIKYNSSRTRENPNQIQSNLPKSYPLIGHLIAACQQKDRFQWLINILISSPSSTFILHRPFGLESVQTADPTVIEHILKTKFRIYQKGAYHRSVLRDLLGDGIFNVEGESWKFQRQVASYEFSTKSLRKFVENVVDFELNKRLIPLLAKTAKDKTVIDFQDILQRFTFDNICKISFGYDPEYLDPSLPNPEFAAAFDEATTISTKRFQAFFPIVWKICRFLNIGSEKKLKKAVLKVRQFAKTVVHDKKHEIENNTEEHSDDLLSRFLKSGHSNETFVIDIVISFLLAGRDTTSAALTWFFWLIHNNKESESEILKEIQNREKQGEKTDSSVFDEVKDMVYIHAALSESMRLFPPVPVDIKEAIENDILPDGTPVKKGTWVTYHPYAMGRLGKLWGEDCTEYRPERWLKDGDENVGEKKRMFLPRDAYSYPVFHGGPRVCLGKEMAFLQMKRVVAGVLGRFRVVPVAEDGFKPVYVPYLTSKMHGGFKVRIEERGETE